MYKQRRGGAGIKVGRSEVIARTSELPQPLPPKHFAVCHLDLVLSLASTPLPMFAGVEAQAVVTRRAPAVWLHVRPPAPPVPTALAGPAWIHPGLALAALLGWCAAV